MRIDDLHGNGAPIDSEKATQGIPPRFIKSGAIHIAVSEAGSGFPLVFAHGLTGSRLHSLRQMAPLLKNYRIIAFDQRGHGDSSPLYDPGLYLPSLMRDDMLAVCDGCGAEKAVIGGESMGAATALLFALQYPDRVAGLMLSIPAFCDLPNPRSDLIEAIGAGIKSKGLSEFVLQNRRAMEASGVSSEAAARWSGVLLSHTAESLIAACEGVAPWVILTGLSELRNIRVPVHIVCVEGDEVHPVDTALRIQKSIPKAGLTRILKGHTLVENPAILGEIFMPFLKTLS